MSATDRKLAADARVQAALEHLRSTHEVLDAACRDLCSVVGASNPYWAIVKLSRGTVDVCNDINRLYAEKPEPFTLEREPFDDEIEHPHAHGCGLRPPLGVVSACRPEAPIPRCGHIVDNYTNETCSASLPCKRH